MRFQVGVLVTLEHIVTKTVMRNNPHLHAGVCRSCGQHVVEERREGQIGHDTLVSSNERIIVGELFELPHVRYNHDSTTRHL